MKKLTIPLLLIALAAAVVVIVNPWRQPRIAVAVTAGPPQPKVTPAEAGIEMAGIQAAVEYLAPRNTRALVVGRGGHIVFEKYWDTSTLETEVELSGFTPALSAILLGVAMNDDRSVNLDAPVSNYIGDMGGEPRGAQTLRQLASDADQASGADQLARVLEHVSGQSYDSLVAERLWKPLGGGPFSLATTREGDRKGTAHAGCCLRARLGDWMRIGELLANDCVFEGSQLTPPGYVKLMLTPTHKESPAGFFTRVDGTFAAHDVARLEADGMQRLWIVPSLKLVILRVGGEPPASQGWDEALIPDSIIRGTSGWQPASAGEGTNLDPNRYAPH
jgi:CubicO group peptidase (beta-lactamase class C family)